MSAIYGVIDLNGNKISETIAERIHAGYEEILISTYGSSYMKPIRPSDVEKGGHDMIRRVGLII